MGVGTMTLSDFETQGGTAYKTAIDNSIKVFAPFAGAFAVHEQSSADMTVRIDSGQLLISNSLFLLGVQNTLSGQLLAPASTDRWDLIVINMATGSAAVVTGTQSAGDPAVSSGFFPVARVRLQTSTTQIANTRIDDLRPHHVIPSAGQNLTVATEALARTGQNNADYLTPLRGQSRTAGTTPSITASHTIVQSANGQVLNFNNGSAHTWTLPEATNGSLSPGFQFAVAQVGSGKLLFAAQSGTTLRSYNGANQTAGLYAIASVIKDFPNSGDWFLAGNVSSG